MDIRKHIFNENYVFTKWVMPTDELLDSLDKSLKIVQTAKSVTEKIRCCGSVFPAGQAAVISFLFDRGFKVSEIKALFPLTKKTFKKLLKMILEKSKDPESAIWTLWGIQIIGFIGSTKFASSYEASDFVVPDDIMNKKNKLVKDFNDGKIDEITFDNELKKLAKEVIERYEKQGKRISDIIKSGAAKNEIENIKRMLLARGLSLNSKGEINKVITSSLAQGVDAREYIASSSEAIVSQYHKSRSTAQPGYLARQLTDLLTGVIISEKEDCGSKKCLEIKVIDNGMEEDINGNRYDCSGKLITDAKVGKIVKMRSPLYCKAEDGICRKCLGEVLFKKGFKKGDSLLIAGTGAADALTGSALKFAHKGMNLNKERVNFQEEIKK